MPTSMTIGDLSRETDVPASAIRYYERAGLLTPAGRTDGNYRVYGPDAPGRLRFLKTAQTAGFTLHDIGRLLEIRDGGKSPCKDVKELVEYRLDDLQKKLHELRDVEDVLESFLALCGGSAGPECKVLDRLDNE